MFAIVTFLFKGPPLFTLPSENIIVNHMNSMKNEIMKFNCLLSSKTLYFIVM